MFRQSDPVKVLSYDRRGTVKGALPIRAGCGKVQQLRTAFSSDPDSVQSKLLGQRSVVQAGVQLLGQITQPKTHERLRQLAKNRIPVA